MTIIAVLYLSLLSVGLSRGEGVGDVLEPTSCAVQDVSYITRNSRSAVPLPSDSAAACGTLCWKSRLCTHYTWTAARDCYLLHANTVTSSSEMGSTSGPKACSNGCRDGWSTYRGYCYLPLAEKLTLYQALAECDARGGTLPRITDDITGTLLLEATQSNDVWLGLLRVGTADHWHWASGEIFDSNLFSNWGPGEPNNYNDMVESCTLLQVVKGRKWTDVLCTSMYSVVCQTSVTSPSNAAAEANDQSCGNSLPYTAVMEILLIVIITLVAIGVIIQIVSLVRVQRQRALHTPTAEVELNVTTNTAHTSNTDKSLPITRQIPSTSPTPDGQKVRPRGTLPPSPPHKTGQHTTTTTAEEKHEISPAEYYEEDDYGYMSLK